MFGGRGWRKLVIPLFLELGIFLLYLFIYYVSHIKYASVIAPLLEFIFFLASDSLGLRWEGKEGRMKREHSESFAAQVAPGVAREDPSEKATSPFHDITT